MLLGFLVGAELFVISMLIDHSNPLRSLKRGCVGVGWLVGFLRVIDWCEVCSRLKVHANSLFHFPVYLTLDSISLLGRLSTTDNEPGFLSLTYLAKLKNL